MTALAFVIIVAAVSLLVTLAALVDRRALLHRVAYLERETADPKSTIAAQARVIRGANTLAATVRGILSCPEDTIAN